VNHSHRVLDVDQTVGGAQTENGHQFLGAARYIHQFQLSNRHGKTSSSNFRGISRESIVRMLFSFYHLYFVFSIKIL